MEKLESLVVRLEKAVSQLESGRGAGSPPGGAGDTADAVDSVSYKDYNDWIQAYVTPFIELSNKLGDDIAKMGNLFNAAIMAQRQFILMAAKHSKPADSDLQKCLEPQVKAITAVTEFRESSRRSKFFNHLSSVSEAIPALSWILISPTPGPHVKEMKDAAMFYTNRVLKDYKGKDEDHVQWTKLLLGALNELINFIKKNHTTGLVWNVKGTPASPSGTRPPIAPKPKASSGGGPPPPPPPAAPAAPLPPPPSGPPPASASGPEVDHSALFASINQGGDITKGLKKVTSDMQTHKNPNLRGTSVVPSKPGSKAAAPTPKPKFGSAPVKKDPVTQLDGKKWMIEYHDGNKDIAIEANMKQTVYIYKCVNSTIKVTGKVNSITMDACKKCAIVFENSVAALEVIGSQSIQAQVTGKVPIVNVDKTDGFQLYLSLESLEADIVTAKVSEVNIMIPDENGEYLEKPVVEQFRTYWDPKKKILITEPVEIAA